MKNEVRKYKYEKGPNRKDHTIQVRLSAEDMRELEIASYLDDRTKSDHVRRAIRLYNFLRKNDPEVVGQIKFD
jgi:hypothetical protein